MVTYRKVLASECPNRYGQLLVRLLRPQLAGRAPIKTILAGRAANGAGRFLFGLRRVYRFACTYLPSYCFMSKMRYARMDHGGGLSTEWDLYDWVSSRGVIGVM